MSWRCPCGAENFTKSQACEYCGREQQQTTATNAKTCAVCGGTFRLWQELHQGEDDLRRCGRCHMHYLKSRTSRPEDRCTEPGCPFTVRQHMEATARLLAVAQFRTRRESRPTVVDVLREDYSVEQQEKKWAALARLREMEER